MRPVVPQDRAAAAARAAFALVAVLVAVPVWERPVIALLTVAMGVVFLAVGLVRPWKTSRAWVGDLAEVPRCHADVTSAARATRVGLALGTLGGGVLLLLVLVFLRDGSDAEQILYVPSGAVFLRAIDRLLITRAVRRWEREQGVVLCRRRAPNQTGVELFHEADVDRMVAVPVAAAR